MLLDKTMLLIFAHFVGTTAKTIIKCNRRRATSNLTKIKSTPGDKSHRLISFLRESIFFFFLSCSPHNNNSSLLSWKETIFRLSSKSGDVSLQPTSSSSWHHSWQTRAQGCVKGNKKKLPPIKTCSLEINGISATNRSLGKEWRGSRLSCWFLSEIENH